MEVGLPFSPAEPRGIVLFCVKLTIYMSAPLFSCWPPLLRFNMSIWADATGSTGEKKEPKQSES